MTISPPARKLTAFIRSELDRESASAFSGLNAIPDTYVQSNLAYWRKLNESERGECLDCFAAIGARISGLVHDEALRRPHAYEETLNRGRELLRTSDPQFIGVPLLRAMVSTFKIERNRGVSSIPESMFEYASSVRSAKAPELRKGVKFALGALGLQKVEKLGGGDFAYYGEVDGNEVEIHIDYGGRLAQLSYEVMPHPADPGVPRLRFTLERTLGLGFGGWDRITVENLASSMDALCACIKYAATVPARFEAWRAAPGAAVT